MDRRSKPTNTQSQETIDRLQQCQGLLVEIKELNKQKEKHIERQGIDNK